MEEKYSNVEHQKPVGKMSKEEIDVFLDKGYTLRLACLKPDGSPFAVPCWHHWESQEVCENGSSCDCINGCFWVIPRAKSKWVEYLKMTLAVAGLWMMTKRWKKLFARE